MIAGPISLEGRTALVTGGASGIGLAIASLFRQLGATVVVGDFAEMTSPLDAIYVQGDVCNEQDVARMVKVAVEKTGQLDIAINSAGIADQLVPTIEQDIDVWQRVVDVNLRGTYLVCREAGKAMLPRQRGAIVNISSITGLGAFPRRNAYGASKAAVAMLTRSLASEWGHAGVRVNCIAPGYIMTPMVEDITRRKKIDIERIVQRTPQRRLGAPVEVAQTAAFLVSDWASYISGAILPVDGGWTAFGGAGDVMNA
jgi:NAD(P)-dependent dehydrogenase (short-subunit alcohol dehydrogenase family)